MTDEIVKKSCKLIKEIDNIGGAVSAIEQNFQQNKIADSAYDFQKQIDDKIKVQVGVNKFITEKQSNYKIQKNDSKSVDNQINNLKKFKETRNNDLVKFHTKKIIEIANGTENLIPYIVEAVKANLTLGEISDALRTVFDEYKG